MVIASGMTIEILLIDALWLFDCVIKDDPKFYTAWF
jgi:hypothetical protein